MRYARKGKGIGVEFLEIPAKMPRAITSPPSPRSTIRVTALKGLIYPWALAFLPNGDILVTEQGRNTLRIVRKGVLDPTPITGLPVAVQRLAPAATTAARVASFAAVIPPLAPPKLKIR